MTLEGAPRRPPDPPLEDDVVVLRPPREDDVPAIAAACSDPEIARWVPVPVPYTPADGRAFVEATGDGWATGTDATFAIVERRSGALAGMVGLHRGAVPGRASVGYWLARDARGRGLATRAVRLLAGWAFEDPGLRRLELLTLVGNDASGRVALRAGFRREGILRRYLTFRGQTLDAVMYAMVAGDVGAGAGDETGAQAEVDPLSRVPLFAALAPAELARVRTAATEVDLAPGAVLMAEGDPGDALYVILEGETVVTKQASNGEVFVATVGPGAVQGEIAVLEGGARRATVRAATPTRVLRLGRDDLFDVLAREPGVVRSLVTTVAGRLRGMESILQEKERLASLGTLAAGLAHELNNPAAAARSSSDLLADSVDAWDRACTALGARDAADGPAATPLAGEVLDALREELSRRAANPPVLDPLDAADRRDAVRRLLVGLGMGKPDEPAAALVSLGWDGNQVDDLLAPFATDEARLLVATWLAAAALVHQLLVEVATAAARITEIVGAVREYSFLDRATLQQVDVTTGVENTLVILRARWKDGVTIRRAYAPGVPSIEAHGSELNQVWTNLVGNAIEAMDGRGTLRISVAADPSGDGVVVEVCDSGPGIPPGVRDRIFDPFFTTKDVGAGTGLGLHISRSIVERHGGRLELVSTGPEGTCFRTTLPARVPAVPAGAGEDGGTASTR